MAPALEFANLTKEYRSFPGGRRVRALEDFTLQVEAGEIFGFLGPNGAGKTTAIHLAMGFMRPTRGSGRMLGLPLATPLPDAGWDFCRKTWRSTIGRRNFLSASMARSTGWVPPIGETGRGSAASGGPTG